MITEDGGAARGGFEEPFRLFDVVTDYRARRRQALPRRHPGLSSAQRCYFAAIV